MRSTIIVLALPILALSAYLMFKSHGLGSDLIPILPTEVAVDADNHFTQTGYHYFYDNARWYYAPSRGGQRHELPRSHWPMVTRHEGWDRPILMGRKAAETPNATSVRSSASEAPAPAK